MSAEKNEPPGRAEPKVEKKKPGKQVGAQGYGRQVELPVTDIQYHRACQCAACSECLTSNHPLRHEVDCMF